MKKRKNHYRHKNQKKFFQQIRRRRRQQLRKKGWYIYYFDVIHTARKKGRKPSHLPRFEKYALYRHQQLPLPPLGKVIQFLAAKKDFFSTRPVKLPPDGIFKLPPIFSLTEQPEESFLFLKQLFIALYTHNLPSIKIDYGNCTRIDVDASVCMDVIVMNFMHYYDTCISRGYDIVLEEIIPINNEKEEIRKILFSIGAFKNLTSQEIKYDDILPFHLIVGNNYSPQKGQDKEIEVTQIVDYIINCLTRMKQDATLTWQSADNLSKVIGEVLINAAEHSNSKYRYAIGYFKELNDADQHMGIFNLVIFDFGTTIYENFSKVESRDLDVVTRMKVLSEKYTKRGFFKSREFEEETLWTLYALQEGVTSVHAKRGNGSIHFIESFFRLKGDSQNDKLSSLTILSGNTRIVFDGTYQIQEKPRGKEGHLYKMMTFNSSGEIDEQPDKKYVSFVENFFPGTMIVAKICISYNDLDTKAKETDHG